MEVSNAIITALAALITGVGGIAIKFMREKRLAVVDKNRHRARIVWLEAEIVQKNSIIEASGNAEAVDALIVVDVSTGIIKKWNSVATSIFRCESSRDYVGKHVSSLASKSRRNKMLEAWNRFTNTSGRFPDHGPFNTWVLTKTGDEVAVSILLSGWEQDGQRLVEAKLRRRVPDPSRDSDNPKSETKDDGEE